MVTYFLTEQMSQLKLQNHRLRADPRKLHFSCQIQWGVLAASYATKMHWRSSWTNTEKPIKHDGI